MRLYLHQMANCSRCSLRGGCNQVVKMDVGLPNTSQLMVLTDWPTPSDDVMGRHLTDRAGDVIRKTLGDAGLGNYWLTSCVKCKPPRRGPNEEQIAECKLWLWEELKYAKPKVVLTLGNLPARLLLRLKKSFRMADVVGQFHRVEYMNGEVAPWYSPSFLLQRGKKTDQLTAKFLAAIKEKLS